MEGGARPEFYTIQLANEKELMEWKKVIHAQIEYCRQNDLKCGKCLCVVWIVWHLNHLTVKLL